MPVLTTVGVIVADEFARFDCSCGNDEKAENYGFDDINAKGELVPSNKSPETPADWCYRCRNCGATVRWDDLLKVAVPVVIPASA